MQEGPPPAPGDVKVAGSRVESTQPGTGQFPSSSGPFPTSSGPFLESPDTFPSSPDAAAPTATVPAWAEAPTGFLDGENWSRPEEGWSREENLAGDPPRRGRGRRRPPRDGGGDDPRGKGKGKAAVLAVAAVAVVLGGTVAGVRMMSSATPANCTGDTCTAAKQAAAPVTTSPAADESEAAPDEDPATETTGPTPKPTVTSQRSPRRTPVPKPSKTKLKQTPVPTIEAEEADKDDSTPQESSTPSHQLPEAQEGPSEAVTPLSTESAAPFQQSSRQGAVNVGFSVLRERDSSYTARLSVTNESAKPFSAATVSLPLSGQVYDVEGASSWMQDGDLLILDLPGELSAGESVSVTIGVYGTAETPQTCGVVGAECVMG
ncbi:hypothetical protein ACIBG7_24145 [Nonomuraea sp. NPDC050328]|uniref:hypothetical protein n=1 Tax=Nonomuraea sp. NPDC050328 TaxID=3364361 RepID=UPI0037AADC90